jgi:hypothetical protein
VMRENHAVPPEQQVAQYTVHTRCHPNLNGLLSALRFSDVCGLVQHTQGSSTE